jgi:hypothetical protein
MQKPKRQVLFIKFVKVCKFFGQTNRPKNKQSRSFANIPYERAKSINRYYDITPKNQQKSDLNHLLS